MRRLTRFQYDNVMLDLFGNRSRPAQRLAPEISKDVADDGATNTDFVTDAHALAHDFSLEATSSDSSLTASIGCNPVDDGEAACQARLLDVLLPRILRRPLGPEDSAEFEAAFAAGKNTGGNFASGARRVLEVALQSPEFLYRVEVGEPLDVPSSDPRSSWGRPTPFEMASRLSFLLWGSTPDDGLLAKAAAGGLRTKEEVRAAAEELLADDRSRAVLRDFHLRMLGLLDARSPALGLPENPEFTAEIELLQRAELDAFLEDVGSSGPGGFASLVTAPFSYLNEPLAAFYGVPGVTGMELRKVQLSSPPYAGVLTQGRFLAAHASLSFTNAPRRGSLVLNEFFCRDVQLKPDLAPMVVDESDGLTSRERLNEWLVDPSCAGCHAVINAPGFALGQFDRTGRYQETDNGKTIDVTATIWLGESTHDVVGAADLGRLIARSPIARECYLDRWAAYAYGISAPAVLDECTATQLRDAFDRSDGDIRSILLELTQTDLFLYRPLEEP